MRQFFDPKAAFVAALSALACAAISAPASAHPYEYCRRNVTSFAQSCSFDTLAQCQAMSSGRSGDCYRDPSLGDVSGAYAYAPSQLRATATVIRNR